MGLNIWSLHDILFSRECASLIDTLIAWSSIKYAERVKWLQRIQLNGILEPRSFSCRYIVNYTYISPNIISENVCTTTVTWLYDWRISMVIFPTVSKYKVEQRVIIDAYPQVSMRKPVSCQTQRAGKWVKHSIIHCWIQTSAKIWHNFATLVWIMGISGI